MAVALQIRAHYIRGKFILLSAQGYEEISSFHYVQKICMRGFALLQHL